MQKLDLSFLKDTQLEVVEKKIPTGRASVAKLPEDADIRVFSNGRVYPSKAYAEKFNLEFGKRIVDGDVITTPGNGLDIFTSKDWGAIAGKLPQELIFVSAVPKTFPKVDMWNSAKYDKITQEPSASVFTQGHNTFAKKQLVPMIADIYGVNWDTTEYVDLKIDDMAIPSANGLYNIPKVISGGKFKGEATYVRRENIIINPLVIFDIKEKAVKVVKEAGAIILDGGSTIGDTQDTQGKPSTSESLFTNPATVEESFGSNTDVAAETTGSDFGVDILEEKPAEELQMDNSEQVEETDSDAGESWANGLGN